MQSSSRSAALALVRMLPVSVLMALARARVVSRLVLIWATPSLMERAVPKMVDAVPLMPLAVPLMVPALALMDVARPSTDLARRMISSSLPCRGLAVSRMEPASSLVRPSLSTAWVAVLMPPPVVAITPALSLMCSACHAVRWSRTTATATTATTMSSENVAWPRWSVRRLTERRAVRRLSADTRFVILPPWIGWAGPRTTTATEKLRRRRVDPGGYHWMWSALYCPPLSGAIGISSLSVTIFATFRDAPGRDEAPAPVGRGLRRPRAVRWAGLPAARSRQQLVADAGQAVGLTALTGLAPGDQGLEVVVDGRDVVGDVSDHAGEGLGGLDDGLDADDHRAHGEAHVVEDQDDVDQVERDGGDADGHPQQGYDGCCTHGSLTWVSVRDGSEEGRRTTGCWRARRRTGGPTGGPRPSGHASCTASAPSPECR